MTNCSAFFFPPFQGLLIKFRSDETGLARDYFSARVQVRSSVASTLLRTVSLPKGSNSLCTMARNARAIKWMLCLCLGLLRQLAACTPNTVSDCAACRFAPAQVRAVKGQAQPPGTTAFMPHSLDDATPLQSATSYFARVPVPHDGACRISYGTLSCAMIRRLWFTMRRGLSSVETR